MFFAREKGTAMKTYKTSDLGIAAYLMTKGLKLRSASKEPTGRFSFVFDDPNSIAKSLAIEFVGSCCCQFDGHVKNLKKLIN